MACPNCDHTMQNIGSYAANVFWCPRCGTVRGVSGNEYTPTLLEYAREANQDDDWIGFRIFIEVDILKKSNLPESEGKSE